MVTNKKFDNILSALNFGHDPPVSFVLEIAEEAPLVIKHRVSWTDRPERYEPFATIHSLHCVPDVFKLFHTRPILCFRPRTCRIELDPSFDRPCRVWLTHSSPGTFRLDISAPCARETNYRVNSYLITNHGYLLAQTATRTQIRRHKVIFILENKVLEVMDLNVYCDPI